MTKYDPQTCEGGLFADYINTILKHKAAASGYPSYPEDEDRYVESFNAREGVLMDRDALRINAAKRGLEKLCWKSKLRTGCSLAIALSGLRGDTRLRNKRRACVTLKRSLPRT